MSPKTAAKKPAVVDEEPISQTIRDGGDVDTQLLSIADLKKSVLKEMGLKVYQPETRYFLKTPWPELHRTLGCGDKGIPYGKVIELSGPESHGKSLIQKLIEGCAQRDGAVVIHDDIEESNDEPWNEVLGVNNEELVLVQPKLVFEKLTAEQKQANADAKDAYKERSRGKNAAWKINNPAVLPYPPDRQPKRPQTAEEIFEESILLIERLHQAGVEKMVLGVDSIANLTTKSQIDAGMHQNMRTNADLSMFLSGALKQLQIVASNYNVLVCLVNQIREKPGMMFGDPTYEPGGRALRHACHSRNRVHRKGHGKIFSAGKLVGINGIMQNRKNKMGEGSLEGQGCEYRITWQKDKPLEERVSFTRFVKKEKGVDSKQEPGQAEE